MPHGTHQSATLTVESVKDCVFSIDAEESTHCRLPHVKRYSETGASRLDSFIVTVAFPASYKKENRKKFPIVILSSGQNLLGSAIEMTRGLAVTKEAGECIIVNHDDAWLSEGDALPQATRIENIIAWCRSELRVQAGEVTLLVSKHNALSIRVLMDKPQFIVDRIIIAGDAVESTELVRKMAVPRNGRSSVAYNKLEEATDEGCVIPALIHGVRTFWSTGHAYGEEMMALKGLIVSGVLSRAVPLIRILKKRSSDPTRKGEAPSRHVFKSKIMGRDFEIFVSLPAKPPHRGKGYPAVFALDANTTWSCVMETTARMSSADEIEDVVTIGIGVPRSEGDISFGLRRFEEFSPPAGDAAFANPLGRFFLSIFAMFGRNARSHFGLAPQFHQFLSQELVPMLAQVLPIDPSRLHLLGHSAAGTYVAYEAAQADTPFRAFGVLSPGVAISDSWMLKRDGGLAKSGKMRDILVTIGGDEKTNAFNTLAGIPQSEQYAAELKDDPSCTVEYMCLDGETHTSVFPRAFALFLNRMFSNQQVGSSHV